MTAKEELVRDIKRGTNALQHTNMWERHASYYIKNVGVLEHTNMWKIHAGHHIKNVGVLEHTNMWSLARANRMTR